MSIDKATVKKVAFLARIAISEEETDQFASELNKIMSWIETLNEVDTKNVQPLDHAVSYSLRMRDDKIDHSVTAQQVLKNAQETVLDFYSVPKVVE